MTIPANANHTGKDGRTEAFVAVVMRDTTVLRSGPDDASGREDECFSGTVVSELERRGDWSLVETSYDYRGWMRTSHIWTGEVCTAWDANARHQVSAFFADVLAEPRYQARLLTTLPASSRISVTGEVTDGWSGVVLAGGASGWVRSSLVAPVPHPDLNADDAPLRKAIAATALSYLGTQYRWGGKTREGIDCSGLCSLACMLHGVAIFRDAVFKKETLREIGRDRLQVADLVYFPGHVALYLGGDRVIHSTAALSGVVINSLNPSDPDYRPQLADHILQCATFFGTGKPE